MFVKKSWIFLCNTCLRYYWSLRTFCEFVVCSIQWSPCQEWFLPFGVSFQYIPAALIRRRCGTLRSETRRHAIRTRVQSILFLWYFIAYNAVHRMYIYMHLMFIFFFFFCRHKFVPSALRSYAMTSKQKKKTKINNCERRTASRINHDYLIVYLVTTSTHRWLRTRKKNKR